MITFKLTSANMHLIKYAYLTTHYLRAGQTTLILDGQPFIIIKPTTLSGDYLISVRVYKDGRRNAVVGDIQ